MAATPAPEQQADSAEQVLTAAREARAAADRAEVRILELALDWAVMHRLDTSSLFEFERPILLGGAGTPEVSEYCVSEFAAALHISTDSGRCLIADALELAHRLPRVWARVKAGDLPPWRARRISSSTTPAVPIVVTASANHVAIESALTTMGMRIRSASETSGARSCWAVSSATCSSSPSSPAPGPTWSTRLPRPMPASA